MRTHGSCRASRSARALASWQSCAGATSMRKRRCCETRRTEYGRARLRGPALQEATRRAKGRRHQRRRLVFTPERAPAKRFHHRPFWDRVRAKAGLIDRGYRFHNLRHCFASLAARGGMARTELMLAMRHQSANMTLRYSHLMGSSGRARRRTSDEGRARTRRHSQGRLRNIFRPPSIPGHRAGVFMGLSQDQYFLALETTT